MNKNLDRDFVWECDYGVRKPLVPALKRLLREQNSSSLQMIKIFVNNNPYYLELFIVISYDNPLENHIKNMKSELLSLGIRYRSDITLMELINQYKNKRFNGKTFLDEREIDEEFNPISEEVKQAVFQLDSHIFAFDEKVDIESKGYIIEPLGERVPIFLSHSSKDKSEIEDLMPYLNGADLQAWYDKVNIDYGESIDIKIKQGIRSSGAVLFWITKEFLNSDWCKFEMDSFLERLLYKEEVFILSVIHEEISKDDIPPFILKNKFLMLDNNKNLGKIVNDIVPILKRYFFGRKKLNLY